MELVECFSEWAPFRYEFEYKNIVKDPYYGKDPIGYEWLPIRRADKRRLVANDPRSKKVNRVLIWVEKEVTSGLCSFTTDYIICVQVCDIWGYSFRDTPLLTYLVRNGENMDLAFNKVVEECKQDKLLAHWDALK